MAQSDGMIASPLETDSDYEVEGELYARHAETKTYEDLEKQRGTPIPALYNQFYKFIQNPTTVSVETFKRMVDTDDTIGSGTDFLSTCLAARLGRYQHPSKEITEWVNKSLEKIEGGFFNVQKEILSAAWAGFSVGEKVWENSEEGFVIKKIAQLPPGTVLFETNRTGELTEDGILQYQRNYNPGLSAYGSNYMFGFSSLLLPTDRGYRPDPYAKLGDFPFPLRSANTYSYLSIRIPKSKCVHYAFDAQGKFNNPYGRSLLRRCYKYWVMKDAILGMLAIALDRKGTPLTVVYYDQHTTLIDPDKAQQGVNQKGQKVGIHAGVAARNAFKNVHNDTVMFLPGKKGQTFETDFVEQHSNSSDFIASLEFCNKGIMRALLIPSLIFTGGDGAGSYALGQEHAKTFDKILDGFNSGLKNVLLQQIVKELIAYNFPRSAWQKDGVGDFSKRELTQDEIDKEMAVMEKGVNMGAIDMNDLEDLNVVREKMGLQPRKEVIKQPMDMEGLDEAFQRDQGGIREQPGDGDGGEGAEAGDQRTPGKDGQGDARRPKEGGFPGKGPAQ